MKISHDSDSWNARGVIRRDFRHTHDEPEEIPHRKKGGGKNKQFCRRKPGLEHDFSVQTFNEYGKVRTVKMLCSRCGKVGSYKWQYKTTYTVGGEEYEAWV